MTLAATLLREARARAGLSQRALAERAGTSGPTVAAYEAGAKQPRADTLQRLLEAAGAELSCEPRRGASDRFVDAMCDRLAAEVADRPGVLEEARNALSRLEGRSSWVDVWRDLLEAGPEAVIGVLTSRSPEVRALKADTPLAFVVDISGPERSALLEATHAQS